MVIDLEAALRQSETARKELENIAAPGDGAGGGGSDPESGDSLAALQQQMAFLQVCPGSSRSLCIKKHRTYPTSCTTHRADSKHRSRMRRQLQESGLMNLKCCHGRFHSFSVGIPLFDSLFY